jgi:hypothetical protein
MMRLNLEILDKLISLLQEYKNTGKIKDDQSVRNHIERTIQIPFTGSSESQLLTHPFILKEYGSLIAQRAGFDAIGEDRIRKVQELIWNREQEDIHFRLRRFRPQEGYYYGVPFANSTAAYTFWSEEPVLITTLDKEWMNEVFMQSELGWLSRPEVKMLASLTFSIPTIRGPTCYFQFSDEVYDIPASVVSGDQTILDDAILERIHNVVNILRRMKLADPWGFEKVFGEASPFAFRTQDIRPELTRQFYDSFDLHDELALRTSFLLLKGATLWRQAGFIFGEEATGNLFFALEGCLHLIHRRIFGNSQFEIDSIMTHIEQIFTEKPGYTGMLEDAYEKRVQLVHPITKEGPAWLPSLMADDFYENYGMAVDLLFYAITGEKLPDESSY